MELLAISVGIGLVVALLCTELFGIASGGMIVPGYVALHLLQPWHLVATLGVALATYAIVRLLSTFLIIYGRRRTVLMILIAYVLGLLISQWSYLWVEELSVIGFIIPGLIAVWMDRQSVLQTLSALALVAVITRLILVLTVGAELLS
jgi:poly-gamma-glutamate biosynthesis protein PgsC/CapC